MIEQKETSFSKNIKKIKVKEPTVLTFQWIQALSQDFNRQIQQPIILREITMRKTDIQRCFRHNIIYSLYCKVCRKVLCASCMYSQTIHKKHKVVALENAEDDVKNDIQTLQTKMQKVCKELENMIEENCGFLMTVEHNFNPVLAKVKQFYISIRQTIAAKEKQHIEFLAQKRDEIRQEVESYNKQLSKIQGFIAEKTKCYSNTKTSSNVLIPSRNILEQLLISTMYVRQSPFTSEKYKLLINPANIKTAESNIIFIVSNLIPQFQRNFPSPESQTSKTPKTTRSATSKSKPKPFFQSTRWDKNQNIPKKQDKDIDSLAGFRTTRQKK